MQLGTVPNCTVSPKRTNGDSPQLFFFIFYIYLQIEPLVLGLMRKILMLLAIAITMPVWASGAEREMKTVTVNHRGETKTVDLRDFAKSLNSSVMPRMSMRTDGRDASDTESKSIRWIDRIYNLPDYMVSFYENYGQMVDEALAGQENLLTDPTLGIKGYNEYFTELKTWKDTIPFTYPADADEDLILQIASLTSSSLVNNYFNEVDCFMPYLFFCLSYDFPQAFWIGNIYTWNYSYSIKCTYYTNDTVGVAYPTFYTTYGLKNSDFDIRIEEFNTKAKLDSGMVVYHNSLDSIFKEMPDTSRYEQIRYLNNWLTTHNCYSSALHSDSVPSIIWSPMSALSGHVGPTGPVCEGYARAFKILCDSIGVPNILAIGMARAGSSSQPEAHMWNEVQMEDSLWYGVDVTWNDPLSSSAPNVAISGIETEDWLLVGKNTRINGLAFSRSHPNSITNVNEAYVDYWDFTNETLIADNRYEVPTAVITPRRIIPTTTTVYDLTGRNVGKFSSAEQALQTLAPGLYIINGRKTIIR